MTRAHKTVVAAAILAGIGFASCLWNAQSNWYLGWPGLSYAHGVDRGWPLTYWNKIGGTVLSPYVSITWYGRNLSLLLILYTTLAIALGSMVYRVGNSLLQTGGRPRFSLATLLLLILAGALVKPSWSLVRFVAWLGYQKWRVSYFGEEIPGALTTLIAVGLFCLAYCVCHFLLSIITALVARMRHSTATPAVSS